MADVQWIKIAVDIFDNRKIRQIESMPEGESVLLIWLKLICLAGSVNDGGCIYLTKEIPYTDEMLATHFNKPIGTIRLALKVFQSFGMIEIIDDIIQLSNWEKYQNTDKLAEIREQTRLRVAKHREKQKQLAQANSGNKDVTLQVTLGNAIDKNREDKDIDKNREDNIENENDNENDNENEKSYNLSSNDSSNDSSLLKQPKTTRHKYGSYKNVLLSDEELETLKEEYDDWFERIERLSEYIASSGKKYKNFLATIRSWARKENKGNRKGQQSLADIASEISDSLERGIF